MILGKLVIKCLQKLREVCGIPYCCHTYKLGKISNFFHFGEKLAINCNCENNENRFGYSITSYNRGNV